MGVVGAASFWPTLPILISEEGGGLICVGRAHSALRQAHVLVGDIPLPQDTRLLPERQSLVVHTATSALSDPRGRTQNLEAGSSSILQTKKRFGKRGLWELLGIP